MSDDTRPNASAKPGGPAASEFYADIRDYATCSEDEKEKMVSYCYWSSILEVRNGLMVKG